MKKLIEKYMHKETGYNPFLIRSNWQVAQLNYIVKQGFDDIEKIDIHFKTDEVFILLGGQVILITAEKERDELSFQMTKMEKGLIYNIPKMIWHNIAMSEDAQVIIVEDAGTHLNDFDFYYLNTKQMKQMYKAISNCL
jgi:hypothetical protein